MTERGFLRVFPDLGADDGIKPYIADRDRFTLSEARSTDASPRSICLIAFGDEVHPEASPLIEHIALQRKGDPITSLERRMTLEFFHPVEPLSVSDLIDALGDRYRRHFRAGSIPPATWRATLTALAELRPEAAEAIQDLRAAMAPRSTVHADRETMLAFEREAISLAASIAGFRYVGVELRGVPPDRAPFLENLDVATIREDAAIQHDASVFGDWELIQQNQVGTVEFGDRQGGRLTVINVNRHPIETALGVDLLYYTHDYDAFVLVQYKSLRADHNGQFIYRPASDSSLVKEIERMHTAIRRDNRQGAHPSYRLNSGPFYFKFCRNVTFEPFDTSLMQGMYIPLDFWSTLTESPQLRGRRGGLIVSYENVPRHINNTLFISLVSKGWIGSRGATTADISALVEAGLNAKHSLLLATHTPATSPDDPD